MALSQMVILHRLTARDPLRSQSNAGMELLFDDDAKADPATLNLLDQ
jgi:hypothetical protein